MSNLDQEIISWTEKMKNKSEREKHNFALTISFLIGGVVFFILASSWYFRLSGQSVQTSFFTDIENFYSNQKESVISQIKQIKQ